MDGKEKFTIGTLLNPIGKSEILIRVAELKSLSFIL